MCLKCESKKLEKDGLIKKEPAMADIEPSEELMLDDEGVEVMGAKIAPRSIGLAPLNLAMEQDTDGSAGGGGGTSQNIMRYFVNATIANVRSGPSTSHGITSTLSQGQIIHTVPGNGLDRTATSWSNGWGWVEMTNGSWVAGWPGTAFTNSGNGHLLPVHQVPMFQGNVTGQVNFRVGPGTEFSTGQVGNFLSLPAGTRLNINQFVARNSFPWSFTVPSRDLTQIWLRFSSIVTPAGDLLSGSGWVRADLVNNVPASVGQARGPLMGAINQTPRIAVVMSPTLNRRTGAGTHTALTGQHSMGQILNITRSQLNRTEDRTWFQVEGNSWVASENTIAAERMYNRVFIVSVPLANIRNAPDTSGTNIIGTLSANMRLRITHRRRVPGGMDWFRFDQVIGVGNNVGWIADVNGFIEGEIGSPGIIMPRNNDFHWGWTDSRAVSLRNPAYIPGSTNINNRPFYATRNQNDINQIIIHHTVSSTHLTRMDIEAGWRGLGWWNGGYHEMIHADGRVELCYNPNVITNGAFGQNATAYHIALVGDFRIGEHQPPLPQLSSLMQRLDHWRRSLSITPNNIVGHSERTPTICPGMDVSVIRRRLGGDDTIITPPVPSPSPAEINRLFQQAVNQRYARLVRTLFPFFPFENFPIGPSTPLLPNSVDLPSFVAGPEIILYEGLQVKVKAQALAIADTESDQSLHFINSTVSPGHSFQLNENVQFFHSLNLDFSPESEGLFNHSVGMAVQTGRLTTFLEAGITGATNAFKFDFLDVELAPGLKVKFSIKLKVEVRYRPKDKKDKKTEEEIKQVEELETIVETARIQGIITRREAILLGILIVVGIFTLGAGTVGVVATIKVGFPSLLPLLTQSGF